MFDFVTIMKDWRRMCKAQDDGTDRDVCATCPMGNGGCSAIFEDDGNMDYMNVERVVTKWAAEHPEPKYPTWEEWLVKIGVLEPDVVTLNQEYRFYRNGMPVRNIPSEKMFESIPADIAEKLGIKPKR